MADLPSSDIQFDGVGATAGSAEEAARVLAVRLNHWLADHPHSRILELKVQSASTGANLELTAIIAFLDEERDAERLDGSLAAAAAEATVVIEAEQIVADSEHQ